MYGIPKMSHFKRFRVRFKQVLIYSLSITQSSTLIKKGRDLKFGSRTKTTMALVRHIGGRG